MEILFSFDQSKMIERTKNTCSLLGKAFEKQTNTIEDQWIIRGGVSLKCKNQEEDLKY